MKRLLLAILSITVLLLLAACNTQSTTSTDTTTAASQETIDVTGTWSGDWHRSDGGEEGTISGSVEGNDIVFGMAIGGEDDSVVTIDFDGTISEDCKQMSGEYSMSTGYTGTWSVTKE